MAEAIGNAFFWTLTGSFPQLAGRKPINITRPGVDGVAYRQGALQADPFTLKGKVDAVSSVQAAVGINGYMSMKGTLVTVSMRGVSYINIMVEDVKPLSMKFTPLLIGGLTGNGPRWLVESEWTLRYVGS